MPNMLNSEPRPVDIAMTGAANAAAKLWNHEATFWQAKIYLVEVGKAAKAGEGKTRELHDELCKRIGPEFPDPHAFFNAMLFTALVASFELFLQETLTAVVIAYPKKVGQAQFPLIDILDAPDEEVLVRRAIDDRLNKLMYQKPLNYLDEVCGLLSIDAAPLRSRWTTVIEAKARRDVGVHNGWLCNKTYLRKLAEAGVPSGAALGDSLIPSDDDYVSSVVHTFRDLALITRNELIKTYAPDVWLRIGSSEPDAPVFVNPIDSATKSGSDEELGGER